MTHMTLSWPRQRRRRSEEEATEPTAGTHWWYIAGLAPGAGTG